MSSSGVPAGLQLDDSYIEQFPIGAINHIGLPESTLPKEVGRKSLDLALVEKTA